MKSASLTAIVVQLKPSPLLLGLLGIISIISCVIVFFSPILTGTYALFKVLIIGLIILTSVYFILRDALLILPWSWKMVAVNSKGELTMTNNQGQQFKLTLAKDCIIITNLTILNFKRPNAKLATFLFAPQPVIVFNFSMNQSASHSNTIHQNELRRLTVWLRWHQHHDI